MTLSFLINWCEESGIPEVSTPSAAIEQMLGSQQYVVPGFGFRKGFSMYASNSCLESADLPLSILLKIA